MIPRPLFSAKNKQFFKRLGFRIICQKKPQKFPFQMSKIEKNKAMQKHTKKKMKTEEILLLLM